MIISVDTTKDSAADLLAAAKLIEALANGQNAPAAHPFPLEHHESHEVHVETRAEPVRAEPTPVRARSPVESRLIEIDEETEEASVTLPPKPAPKKDQAVVPRIPPGVQVY